MSIEVTGLDHIYITVSNLQRSEAFYDRVMISLGFRKNTFTNEGDQHIQYYNRHFGFVLRPPRSVSSTHDALSPGLVLKPHSHRKRKVDAEAEAKVGVR